MKIKVLFQRGSMASSQADEQFFEIEETTTIRDLLNTSDGEVADLSDYYPLSGVLTWGCEILPYLFVDEKVVYNVLFSDAKVKDFLNTHDITDNIIRIAIDTPLAGGFGAEELYDLWNKIYPALEAIAVMFTITGFSLKALFHCLSQYFVSKNQPPQTCFDIMFSRKRWSAAELSSLLELDVEKVKELLKLCDYHYDRTAKQYVQGQHTSEIIEKLTNC